MTPFDILAICLKSTPFQEADRVVSFYSAEYGELRAIVKGVKKPTSKLAGACETLTLNRVFLAPGKNLHTVCHYERVASFNNLRQDLERMATATVATELVRRLGRENDPDSAEIYGLLANTLEQLNDVNTAWILPSLSFHTTLLRLSGYVPTFTHCLNCAAVLDLEEVPYFPFYWTLGGLFCRSCQGQSSSTQYANVSSQTLKLLENPEQAIADANYANRALRFLATYWQHRLDAPLKSFDFLFELLG